jgi:thiol-disulfide isomerase/thioredoxin
MKNAATSLSFTVLLIVGFLACSYTEKKPESKADVSVAPTKEEKPALPNFSITDAKGNTVNLSSFKGKKVFVNFWATWCPPCRSEIPSIQKLYSKVDKDKTVFILLSLDDNFDIAKKYAAAKKIDLPVYYPAENLPSLFNINSIPTTFIFNENGELAKVVNGADNYERKEYIDLLKP